MQRFAAGFQLRRTAVGVRTRARIRAGANPFSSVRLQAKLELKCPRRRGSEARSWNGDLQRFSLSAWSIRFCRGKEMTMEAGAVQTVISRDGTAIAFTRSGEGPPLILV